MSDSVKRYDMRNDYGYCGCGMDEAIDGDYVSYEDYETLATRLATLDAERAGVPERIAKALDSLAKAWPVLAQHASHIDGEFSNALSEVRRYLTPTTPEAYDA